MASSAHAWDNERRGFVLGIGLGTGVTSFRQEVESGGQSATSDTENQAGLMTDFKIGYAWSDQWLLCYNSGTSWFAMRNALGDKVTISSDVNGLCLMHYFQPTAPSWFLSGTVGFSGWDAPFEEGSDAWIGAGLAVGGGYEFSPHWYVQGDLLFGNPSEEDSGTKFTTTATTLRVTINVMGY